MGSDSESLRLQLYKAFGEALKAAYWRGFAEGGAVFGFGTAIVLSILFTVVLAVIQRRSP